MLVQFSYSFELDSLQPHGLQHTKLPCPSPTPRVCSNSCPWSQWCHPNISSSVVPIASHLQSFPAYGFFLMSQFFASGGQSIGASASASVFPMNIQDCFPLWGSGKGTETPQGIWLWRPVGFDYNTFTGRGNRLLEGTNKTMCTQGARRKKQCPQKRLSQTCLWVPRSLQRRHGSTTAGCGIRGTEYNSTGKSPFEGDHHYCHYPYVVWPQAKQQGRTQPCPSTENWVKVLLNMALPTRARPSFTHSHTVPPGSFQKPYILFH